MKHTCIIVAAGSGSRMKSSIPKQFIELEGYPILYYTVKVFEDSFVDDIILVVPENDVEYVKKEIIHKFDFKKFTAVVSGSSERYLSVYNGLLCCKNTDYVYIQDGVRPFTNEELLQRVKDSVQETKAVVAAVPVKDTIKVSDQNGYANNTIDRSTLWAVQTPQAFEYNLILNAYKKLMDSNETGITDDACVIERMTDTKVKLVMGDYNNIKITTPEDIEFAKCILANRV